MLIIIYSAFCRGRKDNKRFLMAQVNWVIIILIKILASGRGIIIFVIASLCIYLNKDYKNFLNEK